jgi:hypothetical protein
MTGEELANLVSRLVATWPAGVRGHIWTTELAMLDAGPARKVVDQLARSDDRPPSVARFLDVYRAVTAPLSGIPKPTDTGPPVALDDVIARLEWKVSTGTGSDNDLAELNRWRKLRAEQAARHPLPEAQPTLTPAVDDA